MVNIRKESQEFLSTTEVAELLGVSRITVHKRIRKGEIEAKKIGRNYIIPRQALKSITDRSVTPAQKKMIEAAVKKTVKEYGETLRLLGKE